MALSGTISTTYATGFKYQIVWSATQSVTDNKSTITCKHQLVLSSGYRLNIGSRENSCKVDGTSKSFTSSAINSSGGTTISLGTTTHSVSHNSDGTKSVTISGTFNMNATISGTYKGAMTASKTVTLDTIPRKSTLSASNGTLGVAQTLTVTRKSTSFTHTITYKCGTASGTIVTKSSSTSISFTPPTSLASQNTTGTSVSITFTITTYNGSTSIGSNTTTISCAIPSSDKPSCSISVSDPTGYKTTYGGYVQGQSKFQVTVSATPSNGSAISSYKTTANGTTYTSSSFTTGVLSSSGTNTISTTVTDKRGRTGTASSSQTVLAYSPPKVTSVSVKRCNSDGTENIRGEYVQVTFSASVTSLNSKNSSKYKVSYKKQSSSSYSTYTVVTGSYSVSNRTYMFSADSGSSYDVRVIAEDDFTSDTYTTVVSTGTVIMHWRADGRGLGIGKIGEIQDGLDVGYKLRPAEGFVNISLEPYADLNDIKQPNTYVSVNNETSTYNNCPLSYGTFTLDVKSGGAEGQIFQTITKTSNDDLRVWIRHYYSSSWHDWVQVYPEQDDSGWVDCSLTYRFERYNTSNVTLQTRKIGNIVHLRGVVKPTEDVTPTGDSDVPMAIIQTIAHRPPTREVFICQGSGAYRFALSVDSNGYVYISRYSNSATTNMQIGSGAWLNCFATWFVD